MITRKRVWCWLRRHHRLGRWRAQRHDDGAVLVCRCADCGWDAVGDMPADPEALHCLAGLLNKGLSHDSAATLLALAQTTNQLAELRAALDAT